MGTKKNCALVTGGSGFLGSAIVRQLLAKGWSVKTLQRSHSGLLQRLGAETILGDISEPEIVIHAAKDCQVVFHTAAKAGVSGYYDDYYRCNVIGTKNVLAACRVHNICQLIYTSSPSVVFSGKDENGINESVPYPKKYLNAYQKTKALAEQIIIEANDDRLATVALRPHLIWGPGDPHLVPRLIARAKAGRLWLVRGKNNLVDATYIDNAAIAHILAAEKLAPNARCAGKAYFISNGEPVTMASLINQILAAAHLPPVSQSISASLAYFIGYIMEKSYWLVNKEPVMTRFVARQLACAHWYDLSAAQEDILYRPIVSMKEGLQRLEKYLMDAE